MTMILQAVARTQCAVCRHYIDRWNIQVDESNRTYRVKVWCHGEIDRCTVTQEFLEEGGALVSAIAFVTPAIPSRGDRSN